MAISSTARNARFGYTAIDSLIYERVIIKILAPLHDRVRADLHSLLAVSTRALDVGCGGGSFALNIAEHYPDLEVTGIDISASQIARAQRRAANQARASFEVASALQLPFDDGQFDLVCSLGSIKYWHDRAQGLRECGRVLAPGGQMWIIEADRGCRHQDLEALFGPLVPALTLPVVTTMFRQFVAGGSLDVDETRELIRELPEFAPTVRRAEGLPMWIIEGRAPSSRD